MKIDINDLSECTFQTGETIDITTNSATPTYSLSSTMLQSTSLAMAPIYCIAFDSVKRNEGEGTYLFSQPIIAIVCYNESLYSMENKDLGIITLSAEYDQCLKDFEDEVLFILKEYGEEKDVNLTSDAQELKRRILKHLKK